MSIFIRPPRFNIILILTTLKVVCMLIGFVAVSAAATAAAAAAATTVKNANQLSSATPTQFHDSIKTATTTSDRELIVLNSNRGGGDAIPNFCAAPCACLGDYFECKKQNLRLVPALPEWVRNLELAGNKLDDRVESSIRDLMSLVNLNLKKNHLTRIPTFHGLLSLEKLSLAHNRIQFVSQDALRLLPQLKELDLVKNRIKSIEPGCFPVTNQLNILNLNSNQLDRIATGAFENLKNLLELHLSHNHLKDLPHEVFKSSNILKKLDLSHNRLNISWAIFKGLDQLRVLKLRANAIEYLPDGVFQALKSVVTIELDQNRITNLSRSGFFNLNTLTTLSLANNTIRNLAADTWEFVQQLVTLDLSSNGLVEITRNNFKCLAKLKRLYLQFNQIKYIDDGSFTCLSNLEHLDLSGNRLSATIEGGTFGPFAALRKLQVLDMKRNDVKSINRKAFLGLESLQSLNLIGNNITTIQLNAFEPLKQLSRLALNSSQFLCDCNLQWLHGWLKARNQLLQELAVEEHSLVCDYPAEIRGRDLMSLREDLDFICNESPKPRLLKEPDNQLAIIGTNVTLECSAISSASVPMSIQWRRDNIDIKANETDARRQELGNNTIMASFLHLYNVNRDYTGKYQCVVTNSFGSAYSQRFKITVASFPGFRKTPSNVTLNAGNSARLDCSAYGDPMPQIAWQKDGGHDFPAARERRMHVMTADDAFFIINAKPVDMGIYTCTAENPAGIIKANATLTVHEKPEFVRSKESRQEVIAGKSFVLDCFVRGSPRPDLLWYKDDQRLQMTERYYLAADNQLLIVVDAVYADAGMYSCEIKNALGSEYRYLAIKVSKTISKAIVNGDEMTGIIIITIFCCAIVTSIIWVVIIYHTKKGYECNNNNYVGNAIGLGRGPPISQSMNLHSRFLYQQQQQAANSGDTGEITLSNLYPLANGNRAPNYDNADCMSNKDSGTGDSTKRSRSVDDIHINDTNSNCSNSKATDSFELATYNTKHGQTIPLMKSTSQNQSLLETSSLHAPQMIASPGQCQPNTITSSRSSSYINSNNLNDIKPTLLRRSESHSNNRCICNGPTCTSEQTLPLIQNTENQCNKPIHNYVHDDIHSIPLNNVNSSGSGSSGGVAANRNAMSI